MQAIFHYDAGPHLKARFTTFAAEGFEIDSCREADEARLAALLPLAERRRRTPLSRSLTSG
jgi:hypothetical protein